MNLGLAAGIGHRHQNHKSDRQQQFEDYAHRLRLPSLPLSLAVLKGDGADGLKGCKPKSRLASRDRLGRAPEADGHPIERVHKADRDGEID
jgi:hypothetical protein